MRASRVRTALAGGAALALVLAGCGGGGGSESELAGSWDEIVAAANGEGSVTLYSTHSPTNLEALKNAFESEYPDITLEYVRGTDADILPKIEVESQTGTGVADVHMTTDAGWISRSLEDPDFSMEVLGPNLDNPDFQSDNSVIDDKFFVTSATVFGLGWNTDAVPEGLSTPDDVIDPKFAGKVGIQNPNGIATYVDMYTTIDVDYGDGFVEQLAEVNPRIYASNVAITQALASGEIWAAPMAGSTVLTEKEKGAPVDFALPEKPFGVPWYTHILGSAPNPNAAQVLSNFLVSPEGQAAISADFVAALPNIPGASAVEGSTVTAQEFGLADQEGLDPEAVASYQAEWEAIFMR